MVNGSRIEEDILYLKGISDSCDAGVTRIGLTETYRSAVNYVRSRMLAAGMTVREDSVGNLYGRLEGEAGFPAIVSGSHLDSVRSAGAYDGISGVACALEVARLLKENGIRLRYPFEVLATVEEEGTRFGQVLLGSQFICGSFGEKELDSITSYDGVSLRRALASYLSGDECPARREDEEILAFLELHDEQGPVLDAQGIDVGIVRRIVAISWLTVTVSGFAGHAGTVPMTMRRDAAAGACRLIDGILRHATAEYADRATLTVGKLELQPGSANCIPGQCVFTVDLRAAALSDVDELTAFIRSEALRVSKELSVEIDLRVNSRKEPVEMDSQLRALLCERADALGLSWREMDSGAGHDAMVFAPRWPTAMIFVPCLDGVTHNPAEYVAPDALARGSELLYSAILALNDKSRD